MVSITAGSTNVTLYVYFVDDVSGTATGEPTTGLLFSNIETGGSASYVRQGAARTDFTLVTQTVAGAHTDGGFVLVDDTNMPGLYRLDVPDAAFASGADFVIVQLVAAAANNTLMRPLLVMLPDFDLQSATPDVNVSTISANAITATAINANAITAAKIATDAITNAKIAADAIGSSEFAQAAADKVWSSATRTLTAFSTTLALSVWDVLESAVVTASTMGLKVKNNLDAAITTRATPAEVNTEVDTALADINLDHLVGTAAGIPAVVSGTYWDQMLDDGTATYDRTTDSLQAISDAGGGGPTAAQIADAVWDEDATAHQTQGTFGQAVGDPGADPSTIWDLANTNLDAAISSRAQAGDAMALTSGERTSTADALLNRDMSAVSDTTARSPLNALRFLRNKFSTSGSTLTVTKEDDSTTAWTSTLTTDAAADPVTGSDPA